MSHFYPIPPQEPADEIIETLEDYSPELRQYVIHYAEELAEYCECEARLAD